jgi:flavin-binding protein dodecin
MTTETTSVEEAVKAAVAEERARCLEWARAMRRGDVDDIRSVVWAIEGGALFEREGGDEG